MQQDFYRIREATKADALAMAQVKQITWNATYGVICLTVRLYIASASF